MLVNDKPKVPKQTEKVKKVIAFIPEGLARKAKAHSALLGKTGAGPTIELALLKFFAKPENSVTL